MLYRKEANSRDRKSNIEKGGGGSIVEISKEICVKYSNMTKCLNTFVANCSLGVSKHNVGFLLSFQSLETMKHNLGHYFSKSAPSDFQ